MGGEDSGITSTPPNSSSRAPSSRPTPSPVARAYGFSSDASHRFERGVDFALAAAPSERATA